MPWETRHGRGQYFTRSIRCKGRVTRHYFGTKLIGELAAILFTQQQVERRQARLQRQKEKARWQAAQNAQQELDHLSGLLLQAELLTNGFHKHGGCWRKRRDEQHRKTTRENVSGTGAPGSPGNARPAG
jgi:hypothetical protein